MLCCCKIKRKEWISVTSLLLDGGVVIIGGQHIAKALLWMQDHYRKHLGVHEDHIPSVFLRVRATILHRHTPTYVCRLAAGHHQFHQVGHQETSVGALLTLMNQVVEETKPEHPSPTARGYPDNLLFTLQCSGILHPSDSEYSVVPGSLTARYGLPKATVSREDALRLWQWVYKFAMANRDRLWQLSQTIDRANQGKPPGEMPLSCDVLQGYPDLSIDDWFDFGEYVRSNPGMTVQDVEQTLEHLWMQRMLMDQQESPDDNPLSPVDEGES